MLVSTSHHNLSVAQLIEQALLNGEGYLSDTGAFCTETGTRTGRSTQDRFIVLDHTTQATVDWGKVNLPFSAEKFAALWQRVADYLTTKPHYQSELGVGDHPDYFLPFRLTTETAWHSLFAHNMFVTRLLKPVNDVSWQVLHAANFTCDPERDGTGSDAAVIIDFTQKKILLAGMKYAGELKKSMFSVQNFLLTEHQVLPMHCAVNVDERGQVALFFGLSGTGKTTLSADPLRRLIGDDEHGWGEGCVFNLEGGCYAKTIDLSPKYEPVIWQAIRYGAVVENVVHDAKTRVADYSDHSLSENGRACYPLSHVPDARIPARAGEPNAVIFLTCDVLGVLPPVARLSPAGAAYHFLSGYTARVGSTEMGAQSGIHPVFSACFGAPFMPRPPKVYARLLMQRIQDFGSRVYLVNTGWSGGSGGQGGEGHRFSIETTRAVIHAIQSGAIEQADCDHLEILNLEIPKALPGVDTTLLNPRKVWRDTKAYDAQAQHLADLFFHNIQQFSVEQDVMSAGPLGI
jgi:phosphoenolpyruvate carboxykinase (ATP)